MKKITKSAEPETKFVQPTFGADPEIFIFDNDSRRIVSAIEVLRRDKNDPFILNKDVKFYYDNCMAEFTVRPAVSKADFIASIGESLQLINLFLQKEFRGRYSIQIQASHRFDPEFLEHDEAKKIGCNPEYDADLVEEVFPPDFSGNLRSAGGHIALGYPDFNKVEDVTKVPILSFEGKFNLTRLLDYYLAIPFVTIDNDQTSTDRRTIYGTAAKYRLPMFGVEYRTLPNYWIQSPKLVGLIADLAIVAYKKLLAGDFSVFQKIDKKMVNATVKEGNKAVAREITDALNLPKNIQVRLNQLSKVTNWNVHKEWNLNSGVPVKVGKSVELFA